MARVTINEVSQLTGLSRGTVSRALNNRSDISQSTRQRVLEACKKLNYIPDRAARSLTTGRTNTLLTVVDDLHTALGADFLAGVLRRAAECDFAVHVVQLVGEAQERAAALNRLLQERADAILLNAAIGAEWDEAVREFSAARPTVSLWPLTDVNCDVLRPHQREAGRLAARHMVDGDAGELIYVHQSALPHAEERWAGFREVCAERGVRDEQIVATWPAEADAQRKLDDLDERLRRVRRLAATDDALALRLMMRLARLGREPGRDVAVMGQGNERLAGDMTPGLTSICFCGEEIGRRAVDAALARVHERRMDQPEVVDVAPRLVRRGSTACISA